MPNPNTMASDDEERAARKAKRLANSKLFIELLVDCGYEPVSYSGRGMYGKSCVSVRSDERGTEFIWSLAEDIAVDGTLSVPAPSSDQLGLGMVYYWPSFPWPEDE